MKSINAIAAQSLSPKPYQAMTEESPRDTSPISRNHNGFPQTFTAEKRLQRRDTQISVEKNQKNNPFKTSQANPNLGGLNLRSPMVQAAMFNLGLRPSDLLKR